MIVGVGLPNKKYRQNPIADGNWQLLKLMAPGCSAVKMFSYYTGQEIQHSLVTIPIQQKVVRLVSLQDDLRPFSTDTIVEVFNEPNLEYPTIETFVVDYLAGRNISRQQGKKVCFPGLSPNGTYKAWYNDSQIEWMVEDADYLGVHLYYNQAGVPWQQADVLHWIKDKFPNKPLLVTEFGYTGGENGQVRPTSALLPEYRQAAKWLELEGVEALYYYILGSDDKHWEQVGETFDTTLASGIGGMNLANEPAPIDPFQQTPDSGSTMIDASGNYVDGQPVDQQTQPTNTQGGTTQVAPQFFGRFAAMAAAMGDSAGEPLDAISYWPDGSVAIQASTKGLFYWDQAGDTGFFVPATAKMGADGVLLNAPFA